VARHKRVTGVLVVLLFVWLVGVITDDDRQETAESRTASPDRPAETDSTDEASDPADRSESASEPSSAPPSATSASSPKGEPKPSAPRTFIVGRVVDGDTVELGNGQTVRLVGIDTPEVGECGYERAAANLDRLVLGKKVRLTVSDEDKDRYGRLLRYIDVGKRDAGLRLIKNGLAIARYDSRDGYGFHPREPTYIAADRASKNFRCPSQPPKPRTFSGGGNCAAGYDPCIPPYPPDLDCADVDGPIYVTGSDPHALDAEGDGVGCE